jgi:hypothetical protein
MGILAAVFVVLLVLGVLGRAALPVPKKEQA